jgi:hypothetical protein
LKKQTKEFGKQMLIQAEIEFQKIYRVEDNAKILWVPKSYLPIDSAAFYRSDAPHPLAIKIYLVEMHSQ